MAIQREMLQQEWFNRCQELEAELAAAKEKIHQLEQDCARIASERACAMVALRKAELDLFLIDRRF